MVKLITSVYEVSLKHDGKDREVLVISGRDADTDTIVTRVVNENRMLVRESHPLHAAAIAELATESVTNQQH
jgi:hypothetical protein